ncbi:MAG: hypothetical protein LBP80_10465 [Treponema sp.]|jgi:hypothetical protein|nr:hypothetical protein [Treponema sp.]
MASPFPGQALLKRSIPNRGGFVSILVLDMDTYTEKYGNKAVRKNLTIPAWLNTFAERKHINFSQVLQDSLTAIYERENAAS